MVDAKYVIDDVADLHRYCKRLEDDSYKASTSAEQEGRRRTSDSFFGESMAYCHMAHQLEEIITSWENALREED